MRYIALEEAFTIPELRVLSAVRKKETGAEVTAGIPSGRISSPRSSSGCRILPGGVFRRWTRRASTCRCSPLPCRACSRTWDVRRSQGPGDSIPPGLLARISALWTSAVTRTGLIAGTIVARVTRVNVLAAAQP